jgi:hypothetical protein
MVCGRFEAFCHAGRCCFVLEIKLSRHGLALESKTARFRGTGPWFLLLIMSVAQMGNILCNGFPQFEEIFFRSGCGGCRGNLKKCKADEEKLAIFPVSYR